MLILMRALRWEDRGFDSTVTDITEQHRLHNTACLCMYMCVQICERIMIFSLLQV